MQTGEESLRVDERKIERAHGDTRGLYTDEYAR